MSVTISNSPVHSEIMISYPYGEIDAGYSCGWHTGVDFVPHGTTENNPVLYPVESGTVVYINNTTNVALRLSSTNFRCNIWKILALLSYGIKFN